MPNLTKDNPARIVRDLTLAQKRLEGESYSALAKKYHLSRERIHQIIHSDDIRPIIEYGQAQMVALIPDAINNYVSLLKSKDEGIKLKASQDICKNTGIAPTHTLNQLVMNVYNTTNNMLFAPAVQALLGTDEGQEVMDVPFEEVKD